MSCGGSSSSHIRSILSPINFSAPISYALKATRDHPPVLCFTSTDECAFGTPGFLVVSPMRCLGIDPFPLSLGLSGCPNNSFWQISLVVSLLAPHTHAFMGSLNFLPFHHFGYSPVKWIAISIAPT